MSNREPTSPRSRTLDDVHDQYNNYDDLPSLNFPIGGAGDLSGADIDSIRQANRISGSAR